MDINKRVKKNLTKVEGKVIVDSDLSKPWGFYETFVRNKKSTCKVLGVSDDLSLQSHKKRDEIWYLVKGKVAVYRGKVFNSKIKTIANLKEKIVYPGDGVFIPKNTAHGASNLDRKGSTLVEVALGSAAESDIIRYYDKSGRVKLEGVRDGLSTPDVIRVCRKMLKK